MIIRYIRTLFCKHDFEHVRHVAFPTGDVDVFMCKKLWLDKKNKSILISIRQQRKD